ncbi:L,D-transpeptidase [Frigidibacter sp. ROC022]|uniref:L,D-transpeptidase n=1 Tax=Frigidibacter sp. ROC022 TaxID=2971796 RepID=UPI00215B0CB8|nr:L,D-transpeptidase [Frigidibacter sp. ROC022]MCR8724179.1 L,D-transpeptidase [Frigidibacter sp. ROC022]
MMGGFVSACAARPDDTAPPTTQAYDEGYGPLEDGEYVLPHVDPAYTAGVNKRALVTYTGDEAAGSIIVDPFAKFLFYTLGDGTAMRYPIAVGREGRGFRGTATVKLKKKWPGWMPTQNMIRTEPEVYAKYAAGVPGGLRSPLGARALYLYRGNRDTYYRIHGTNDLPSIGHNSSAGCIRLFNHDIIDLYDRVEIPSHVRVRTLDESVEKEGLEMAHRGDDMAPTVTDIDTGAIEIENL